MDKRSITSAANGKLGGRPKKKVEPPYVEGESWKFIKDAPNYLVSDKGRIFSTHNGGRIMSQKTKDNHYKEVCLRIGKAYKMFYVHRLVAFAFIEDIGKPEVDHIDGDRANNNVSNLRWVTRAENGRGYNKPRGGSSKYRGVSLYKSIGKYAAEIMKDGVKIRLGLFKDEVEAAKAYDKKAIELGFSKEALNGI